MTDKEAIEIATQGASEMSTQFSDERIAELREYALGNNLPPDFIDLLDEKAAEPSSDTVFIDHIQSHLGIGEVVVCKICGRAAKEICGDKESAEIRAALAHLTERAEKVKAENEVLLKMLAVAGVEHDEMFAELDAARPAIKFYESFQAATAKGPAGEKETWDILIGWIDGQRGRPR